MADLAIHLFSAFLCCSRLSIPPSSLLLFILCNHWSFFDPFGDSCSWAWDRKFSLQSFNLSPPSLSHSLARSLICCISHVPYLWDLTGKREFRNTICHSLFSIWCQAFCSHNQLRSLVPMSPILHSLSASVSGLSRVNAPIYVNNLKPNDYWQNWAFLHIIYDVVLVARDDGGSAVHKVSSGLDREHRWMDHLVTKRNSEISNWTRFRSLWVGSVLLMADSGWGLNSSTPETLSAQSDSWEKTMKCLWNRPSIILNTRGWTVTNWKLLELFHTV